MWPWFLTLYRLLSVSRKGGGVAAAPYLAVRDDQRFETERRQQLAHSIQLLQQKAARQQQEVRLSPPAAAGPVGTVLRSEPYPP